MANNGILVNGLFLSANTPKANQRGLLIDRKFFIPLAETGGGSAEYYRCASVDTAAKTWTGYKAVLTDGVYAFDTTVTTGLTYTSVTPVVGNIYTVDGFVKVNSLYDGLPTDGLVFYAPLNTAAGSSETGQALTTSAGITFGTTAGIPCATFSDATQSITFNAGTTIPYGSQSRSFSFWVRSGEDPLILSYGNSADHGNLAIYGGTSYGFTANVRGGMLRFGTGGAVTNTWNHYVMNLSNVESESSLYRNNIEISRSVTTNWYLGTSSNTTFNIGYSTTLSSEYLGGLIGSVAAFRIYNKTLNTTEIASLYQEFTPTA